jgi:hypothetical protein
VQAAGLLVGFIYCLVLTLEAKEMKARNGIRINNKAGKMKPRQNQE